MFEGEGQIAHREGIGTLKRAEKCPGALVPAMPSAHHAPMNHAPCQAPPNCGGCPAAIQTRSD